MSASDLLFQLRDLGVEVWSEGERLRLNAPAGVLTPALRAELSERKGEILSFLERAERAGRVTVEPAPPIVPVPRQGAMPLSFAQQRLWLLEQLQPGSPVYHVPGAFRLTGPLSVPALAAAFSGVVARHEALRTRFRAVDGEPVQIVDPPAPVELPRVDLSGVPGGELERLVREEARRPFDLARGPLLRCTLARLDPEEHVLLVTLHHVVSDAWSLGLLTRELAAFYRAALTGTPAALPALPVQYADFAAWQRQWLQGEVLAAELVWWRERLAGAPPVLELPSDRPRPAVRNARGAARPLALSVLPRTQGMTPFMTLLAGWLALLSRTTGEVDLPVGTPIAGRNRVETEGLIGFFVNTLVIRGDLSGDPSFRQLLERVREASLEAFRHQDLPFEKLVEELRPERSLSHTPLFQVMFALQNVPAGPLALEGLCLEQLPLEAGIAKFDLLLTLEEGPGGFTGTLDYSADLFEAATAERLLGWLGMLLAGAAVDPGARISALPLLSAAERQQLLEWTDTRTTKPRPDLLHGLFEAQADRTPDSVAIVFDDLCLSYGRLEAGANQVARHLRRRGAGPEVRVGLRVERSPELVVGVCGILKSGAAYVPLDPDQPSERLLLMAEDAGASLVLTCEDVWKAAAEDGSRPVAAATGEDAAYVIYTSGSTGQPKGVVVRHAGIANHMLWMDRELAVDAADRLLQKTPIGFDASVWELFAALMSGGVLVLARPGGHREPGYLIDAIERHQVTLFQGVPSLLRVLLEEPGLERRCRSLRRVVSGGEALDGDVMARFFERLPGELINVYGPTEATINATFRWCRAAETGQAVPIGRPLANAEVLLLDRALEPVPAGVAGELCLGGEALARGYLGRPDLTAERFIPHPWSTAPGARLYRTGDLARWTADGNLAFLGRLDHQVKIRGVRIEPSEVETALLRHPMVREAVVVARPELAAYVVLRAALSGRELRDYLLGCLPEPMVPSRWVVLDRLPRSASGKVDRKALPDVSAPAGSFVGPRSPAEGVLAGIWSEVLGVERVGVHDNFFDLGGHSLLAARVASRVQRVFGVELRLRQLFEAPTVATLAALLDEKPAEPAAPIPRAPRDLRLPLSFAQRRLWFLDQLQPGSPAYNMPVAFRVRGALSVPALAAAAAGIVHRHEVLRTTFPTAEGEPFQTVAPLRPPALPVIDLAGLALEQRDQEMERRVAEEARRPFTLDCDPMLRVHLLRLSPEESVLVAVTHHIASDGWSTAILVRELTTLYNAFLEGRPSPLPDLPIQYADFAAWQRERLCGEVLEREVAGWRERLRGLPSSLELPADRPRPAARRFQGAVLPVCLPQPAAADLARREGATLFMVLLAAFQALLARLSGQEDFAIGVPVAGRDQVETEGLVGFFVNTLVLRGDLSGDPTVRELLARVRETALEAFRHQELPFEKLVEELHPERSLGVSPLFQVVLAFQNLPREAPALSGLTLSPLEAESGTAKFDLVLTLAEEGGEMTGSLRYDTDLFDRVTAERLRGHLSTLAAGFAAQPEVRLGALPLLPAAERQQVVREWSRGSSDCGREACLHELFAAQAARTPDAVAVSCEGVELSYGALAARAGGLARLMRRRGVGPGVLVGLRFERSPEQVAALLAVLAAGGAYLPLDPDSPQAHLDSILEEARPALVLGPAWPESGAAPLGDVSVPPDSLAYVIYTSGSTGRPKGVMMPHRAIANLLLSRQTLHPLGGGDRFLQQAPFGFEMSTWEVFATLMAGARLVLARPGGQRDSHYLVETVREEGVTALRFTPSMLRVMLDEPEIGGCRSLRLLFSGAEPMPAELPERLGKHLPGTSLQFLYGPTETCVTASLFTGPPTSSPALPIGRAIAGAELYPLDAWLEPVPAGAAGELYIGGPSLSRGYLGRPDLTAERFVPHPFASGERLYRTGDRVRWLPDGRLEFLGRIDYQLKVRGFRVEPGEIEVALMSHPAVREAVVVMRDTLLVAYVAADIADDLRRFVQERLPEFMVPAVFVRLESLPRTRNGKVDRAALPAPDFSNRQAGGYVAPRGPAEELIAGIWKQVMGIAEIGVHDDFFHLGGHSLLATRVVSRLRQAFGIELPLRTLFESPTVAGLAEAVERRDVGTEPAPPVVPVPRDGRLPLSFSQQRLWFLEQLQPGNPAYHVPAAFRLTGPLSLPALAAAFSGVVARHEALRTRFPAVAGEPEQVVDPPAPVALPLVDLSGVSDRELERLVHEEVRRPFDLARGPLLRCTLVRLGPTDHAVLVTLHHVVSDAWSLGLLAHELAALYRADLAALPALPVQYADFAAWQRQWLQGEALAAELTWWRERLAGAPPVLELPSDRPRPAVRSARGAALPITLSVFPRTEGVTPFMTLLAGWLALLGRTTGEIDLPVGTPIAGRNRVETEGLIGFFVNTLVVRGDLSGDPSFRQLLERVREASLEAFRHQDLPFEKLVEELRPERSLSHTPLFQVMFALQNVPAGSLELEGLRLEPLPLETGVAKFDLMLTLSEGPAGFAGALEYSADLFEAATIGRLASWLETLLASAAADPGSRIAALPLLSPAERQQLLVEWTDTRTDPREGLLHELFEAQADRTPDAVAVVFDHLHLSYAGLEARANQVARHLQRRGMGPESLVGICLERSLELVIGVYGTLKAGAAYVPLDPEYPRERLLLMREGVSAVLTRDEDWPEIFREDRSRPVSGVTPSNAAYVIYTSGSTGRPKGAVIRHASIASHMRWMQRDFPLDGRDCVLQKTPVSFDASVWEFYAALAAGGRLALVRPGGHREPGHLADEIERHQVTVFQVVPSLLRAFLEEPGLERRCRSLRWLFCGGEALGPDVAARFCERLSCDLVDVYGPAEGTITSTFQVCRRSEAGRVSSIGRPLADVEVYLLDRGLEPVPAGVAGELYVGGAGLGRGYLDRPNLTAERFVPHPWSAVPGARLYRTGDLARWLADGRLAFLGRVDHQIKVRGIRTEPGEIEAVLRQHPGVREAAVVARDGSLAAYVVGEALSARDLRSHLLARLPEPMVPSWFTVLERLPLNPSGKVDRKALPAPDVPVSGEAYVAPRTPAEETLAAIWSEVLGVARVGMDDNFFELGGHSLLATQVIARVRQTFGVELPLRDLFETPSVAGLAESLDAALWHQGGRSATPAEEVEEIEL